MNLIKSRKTLMTLFICMGFINTWPPTLRAGETTNVVQSTQQKHAVSGVIKDINGEPVIGASVVVKGTNNGTITDMDGHFQLVVDKDAILVISFIGYKGVETPAIFGKPLNIILKEDSKLLDEVIVVGYGTMKKKDLTGSITRIDAEKIAKTAPTSIGDMLRTGAPGLSVGADNSAAGEAGALLVRGQRSLAANNAPLLVVDGVVFYGSLYELNKNDIESIDVLKDASSAAVYGSKSANGVIIITTKKGKSGKPTVRLDANVGFVTRANDRKVYDADGFLQFRSDLFNSTSKFETPAKYMKPTQENLDKYGITIDEWRAYGGASQLEGSEGDTDIWMTRIGLYQRERNNYFAGVTNNWYDSAFQTGIRQEYNVSISGKTDKVNYYWSIGVLDSEGIIKKDDYKQYTSNLKLNGNITKFLEVGVSANFSRRTNNDLDTGTSADDKKWDWAGQILNNSPYSSLYAEDGTYEPYPNGQGSLNTGYNQFYTQQYRQQSSHYSYLNASLFAKVKLPFNITYEVTYAPRFGWFDYKFFESADNILTTHNGSAFRTRRQWFEWQIDNIIRWDYTFADKHHINLTLLQNSEEHWYESERMNGSKFNPTDVLGWHNMKVATEKSISSDDTHSTGDALMARLFYSFDNRYMITASVRRDGYSAFGKSNPRATFPSVALAWNFGNEEFFKWKPMSMGKLRLSWGKNGNRDIGIYQALANLSAGQTYIYAKTDGTCYENLLFWTNRMANYGLKWEQTTSINIGLDFGFFNNRLNGSIDYYHMPTKDLLVNRTLPILGGFDNVTTNLGEVLNQGVEVSLNSTNIQNKNFTWGTSFGLSHNKNQIKHLFYTYDENGKENDVPDKGWFIGKDINTIWDYKMIGIWQENEAEEAAKYGQRPGDPKALDVDENYKFDNNDKVFMGQKTPKVRLSMRNDFTYKNFDLSFNIYAYLGHKEAVVAYMNNDGFGTDRGNSYIKEYWTPENPTNEYARLWSQGSGGISPRKVLNKSFLRMDNISLSYSLPKRICQKIYAEDIRFTGSVRNVFVISGWEYWDPEITGPMPRTFSLGASITF